MHFLVMCLVKEIIDIKVISFGGNPAVVVEVVLLGKGGGGKSNAGESLVGLIVEK